jgi:MFS transporter, FHS family, glucose/mannose:H+ symporter
LKTYTPYITAGFVSLFALAFLDNSRSPVFQDIIVDLDLKDGVAALFFAATSFMSFVLGRTSPRILAAGVSLLNLVRIGHLLMLLGFVWISKSHSIVALISASGLFGVGYGIINLTQNILIIEGSAPALRRRLLSGLHSVYALASLVAPVVISFCFEFGIEWRQAFVIFSVFPLGAIVMTFFAKNKAAADLVKAVPAARNNFNLKNFLVSLGIAFYVVGEILVTTRLPLYLRRDEGFSPESAARYLGLFFLLLFIGRLSFAFVKFEKISNRQIMLVSLALATLTTALGVLVHPAWFAWSALPMAPFFGVALNYITESFGQGVNAALGAALSLQSLFVVAMHYGIGMITESWGIRTAMLVTPIFLILSGVLIFIGSKTSTSSRKVDARAH